MNRVPRSCRFSGRLNGYFPISRISMLDNVAWNERRLTLFQQNHPRKSISVQIPEVYTRNPSFIVSTRILVLAKPPLSSIIDLGCFSSLTSPYTHQTHHLLQSPISSLCHWAESHLVLVDQIHCSTGFGKSLHHGCNHKASNPF